jgi:hypothetical protein
MKIKNQHAKEEGDERILEESMRKEIARLLDQRKTEAGVKNQLA